MKVMYTTLEQHLQHILPHCLIHYTNDIVDNSAPTINRPYYPSSRQSTYGMTTDDKPLVTTTGHNLQKTQSAFVQITIFNIYKMADFIFY